METAAISYRVADFLKKHPPFNAIDEADLLALAARGRVRFHEPNEYILWQGEPHAIRCSSSSRERCRCGTRPAAAPSCATCAAPATCSGIERYNDAPHVPALGAVRERRRHLRVSGGRLRRLRAEVPARRAVRRGRRPGDTGLSAGRRPTRDPHRIVSARRRRAASRSRPAAARTASRDAAERMLATGSGRDCGRSMPTSRPARRADGGRLLALGGGWRRRCARSRSRALSADAAGGHRARRRRCRRRPGDGRGGRRTRWR